MKCKNCGNEMPDVGNFCPYCTAPKDLPEEQETVEILEMEEIEEVQEESGYSQALMEELTREYGRQPMSKGKRIAVIAIGAVLLGVLILAVLVGLGVVDLSPYKAPIDSTTGRPIYTTTAEEAEDNKNLVVAKVGNKKLTNGDLQLYYNMFLQQNYFYLMIYGADLSQPLGQQMCPMEENMTWEEYIVENAILNWQQGALFEILAEQNGFVLPAEQQEELGGMEDLLAVYAIQYGFDSPEAYIQGAYGANVSVDNFIGYATTSTVANSYVLDFVDKNQPDAAAVEAYYAENEATFVENGITKDLGLQSDVRHILIQPQGGTVDEETGVTTYSQEEWDAAKAEAEGIYEQWKSGEATEESFAELANTHSADGGSNTNGGLYEEVNADSSYVPEFLNWSIDASRKSGDTAIVQTDYGYHIMYFVSGEDYWFLQVSQQYLTDQLKNMLTVVMEENPLDANYEKVCLAPVSLY